VESSCELGNEPSGWRALVNSVMNLRVPLNAENYRVAAQLVASRMVLSSTQLVILVTDINIDK
jgi:hypothetical protein